MNMILFLAAGAVAYLVKPYFGDLAANHFTNQNHGKTSVINPQDFTFLSPATNRRLNCALNFDC
jgi:hypothetical protein